MSLVPIFAISFAAPFVLIRTLFAITTKPISMIHKKLRLGYKFHHLHYGLIITFIGCLSLLFSGYTKLTVVILAVGMGMAADEFLATLLIPEQEPQDTKIYKSTFRSSLALVVFLLLVIAVISALVRSAI